ncbi:DUF2057 family protein [uncultured Vibrio sp.]|uniref:YccT family protein n=1 Tax=uncultured Vibrio sp. TaxID=114054 RepID=UPI0025F5BAD1|nr:DUF2057 family protein [uncultured Vibrio sp.]
MKFSLVVTVIIAFFTSSVVAGTLSPKSGVSIYFINGEVTENKISSNPIAGGINQIVVRMDKNMSRGSKSDVFTSNPYVVSFFFKGENVVVEHPVARSRFEAEKAFDKESPEWIITVDGKPVTYTQEMLEGKGGFLQYSGMEKLLAKHNEARGIYFEKGLLVDQPTAAAMTTVTVASAIETSKPNDTKDGNVVNETLSNNLDQLKAWYQKASKSERKEFRRWMIDQE